MGFWLLLAQAQAQNAVNGQPEPLVYDVCETSQIDGRLWNTPFPNAKTFDAVHRSVLLRFPGAAEQIKSRLDKGLRIDAAEIELTYAGYELRPDGYVVRDSMGRKKWEQEPPHWHVVAWPLRRPWKADITLGPTFIHAIKYHVAWTGLGASNLSDDRSAITAGPAELSAASPVAHLDISDFLKTGQIEKDLGQRLRFIEENGVILKKFEEYDSRYRDLGDAYEWAVPTGGHGLSFTKPRLIITFVPSDGGATITLVPPANFAAIVSSHNEIKGKLLHTEGLELATFRQHALASIYSKPAWMDYWQYDRVQELLVVGGDSISRPLGDLARGDPKRYNAYLDELWRTPPRYWKGWGILDDLIVRYQFGGSLPQHIKDHTDRYWTSWLMPDIPTSEFFHPNSNEADAYIKKSGGWRGRASFFRAGYNYVGSTQNFNHTASIGALLAGNLIGSHGAMADGRNGLENLLLRYWSFKDGSSQEMLDHYYLSITLSAQKLLADFGPSPFDRLAGRIMLERTMEMLATQYHPVLRRFVGPSGRARASGVLVEQDGIYSALHTLSLKGVLNYLDRPFDAKVQGMPIWGYDVPPGRVGLQSSTGPWAPKWFSKVVDSKTFPFEEMSAETVRGHFNPPLWRNTYLGAYYGLASQDIKGGAFDVLAQWSRTEQTARSIDALGTMWFRYCVNVCDMVTTRGGTFAAQGGISTFQHKNRAIVFTRPLVDRNTLAEATGPEGLTSLATVVAIWNFQNPRTWQIYLDGRPIPESSLPLHFKASQVLTIQDGPSYVGLRSLPATNLGRGDEELILSRGGNGGKSEPNGAPLEPTLTLTSYNLMSGTPIAVSQLDWDKIGKDTFGGFAVELGDSAEYKDFASFNEHMKFSILETDTSAQEHTVHVRYRSGSEEMSAGFATDVPQMGVHFAIPPGMQTRAIQDRKVNGKPVYLDQGLERDTSWSQQGTTGRLAKNGAILETDPGRKAYLIASRDARGILAYNPLPDSTNWSLTLPDGARIKANGKVGLLRVAVDREANTIQLDHAPRDRQQSAQLAVSISLKGFPKGIEVYLNGKIAGNEEKTVQRAESVASDITVRLEQ